MNSNDVMVERLKAELSQDGPRVRVVQIPEGISWIPCPNCSLPFKPGGTLFFDVETKRGVCDGCGEGELTKRTVDQKHADF